MSGIFAKGGLRDNAFPILSRIFPKWSGLNTRREQTSRLKEMMADTVDEHMKAFTEHAEPRVRCVTVKFHAFKKKRK